MKKTLFYILAMFTGMGVFAQQPVVAVAPFDAISGISTTEANMITRVFFIRLGNTNKVSLVDRGVVERVLKEHSFQAGDWSNQQKTAELGTALNADWIVRGEMEKFGNNILVTVQFYDIRTFRFMGGSDLRLANADEAYDKMDPLVNKLVETIASSGTTRPPAVKTTPSATYKIGDKGPGGGTIFFARDGKYLECSGELGDHKEWRIAKTLAENYDGGGFTDWHLPTIEEMEFIYINLKLRGVGSFNSSFHWSSSENGANNVWGLIFSNGERYNGTKNGGGRIRAIRSF
jgi:TolB-like protein